MNKHYILFFIAFFCAQELLAKPFEVDGVWYESTSESTVQVVEESSSSGEGTSFGFRKTYEGDIVIPENVVYNGKTYTVTAIKNGTFRRSAKLLSVSIPATLTDLGSEPFADCPSLSAILVDAANPAYTIVEGILYNKDITTLIACPGKMEGEIVIPSTVITIDVSAFHGCAYITSVSIPETVNSIGKHAFQKCYNLITVNLPEGINNIADSTFNYCLSLNEITIPQTVKSIGVMAFYNCGELTGISLPDAVETIADYAFSLCFSLNGITLPKNLKTIGYRAFENCGKIKNINIPSKVTEIATLAFCGCNSLTKITVAEDNTSFSSIDGVLYDKEQLTLLCYPSAKQGDFDMPSTVTTIGQYAFYAVRMLNKLVLPISVKTIEEGAFRLCSGLKTITMPMSVTTLGSSLFVACTALEAIIYYAAEPPVISPTTFTETNQKVPLYVLQRSIEKYKNAEYWNGFSTILPIDDSMVDEWLGDVNNDKHINMTDVITIINYILGRNVPVFMWQNADLNFDGLMNMVDVTKIINLIINR